MVPSKKSFLSSFSDAKPTRLLFYIFCRDLNTRSSSDAAKPRPLCRSQNDDNVLPPHNSAGGRKRMWLKKEFLERVREWLVGWMDQLFYQNGWCPKLLWNDEAKLSATMRLQMSWIMISFCKLVILEGQQSKLADFLSAGAQTMWY